jgi:HEAT repeat protein
MKPDSEQYRSALERILPPLGWAEFVDIDLDPLALSVVRPGRMQDERVRGTTIFSDATVDQPWLVVGSPGSGKSTLLATFARERIGQGHWVLFLPMASFEINRSIEDQLTGASLDRRTVRSLLRNGGTTVIFDAVDESPYDDIEESFTRLLEWADSGEASGNTVIMSCRTADVPPWVHPRVAEVSLLPISDEEIDRVFEEIRRKQGRSALEASPLDGLYRELRELCRNPLLLMMTAYLYQSEGLEGLHNLRSKANLYKHFFDELNTWERIKRRQTSLERAMTSTLRESLLAELGLRLHLAARVYVREADLLGWVGESLRTERIRNVLPGSRALDSLQVMSHLVSSPPMNARPRGGMGELEYGFLHQTFGDVFAAMALHSHDDPFSEAEAFIRDPTSRHWEVIGFLCGLLDGPERLVQKIVRIAFEERRQDLLLLAARSIRDRWDLPPSEADDLCMRILEAFKYWDAFDYRLIHALGHLGLSSQLPRRIVRDVQRFVVKYASWIPMELVHETTEHLIYSVETGTMRDAGNAAYTLGQRRYRSDADKRRVVKAVIARASVAEPELHEQLIAALKDLASADSRSFLESICADAASPSRSRAFALNALGVIGDLRSVGTVIDFMLDHRNMYRDSASWSLQMLAKVARNSDPDLFDHIKRVYAEALLVETPDVEGVFAKGNMMYSLGALGATEYLDAIVGVLATEEDPYVIEDGVNAVGLLAGSAQVPILRTYLNHDDPIVRMKAGEALLSLDHQGNKDAVSDLLMDRFRIVRDSIRSRLAAVSSPSTRKRNRSVSIQGALSRPIMDRDQVTVRIKSEHDAKRIMKVAEALLEQRTIQSRPRTISRGSSVYLVFSEEAFTAVRRRFEEGSV